MTRTKLIQITKYKLKTYICFKKIIAFKMSKLFLISINKQNGKN